MSLLLAALLFAAPALAAPYVVPQQKKLPSWAHKLYQKKLSDRYEIACLPSIRPCVLEADFEGDGKADAAVTVRKRASGALGAAVFLSSGAWHLMGAGTDFGGAGTDWAWAESWKIFKKGPVKAGPGPEKPPTLAADAILIEKKGGPSGLVYFDGKKAAWYQLKAKPEPKPKPEPQPEPQTQP
jgi:hypothetical protein